MVVGMIAAGWPLLTETASAQTASGWYLFRPISCDFGEVYYNTLQSWQGQVVLYASGPASTRAFIFNSELMGGVLKLCSDGTPFYAWWTGQSWEEGAYHTIPGLQ